MSSLPQLEPSSAVVSEDQHLRTDHLLHNIGSQAVSGGFVTVAAQAAKFALTFAGAAILARLLTPREFGLVGMVLAVTALVGIFNELGLSTATVQCQEITQQQVSNLFWVNVGVSGIATLVCCGLAPLLARFYHDPRVAGIMLALSPMFVLTGSTVQHRALLTRQMRFRSVAVIDVVSMFVGFGTACALAWIGFAYWALVAQQMTNALACLVLSWSVSKWRPTLPRRNSGVRPLLSFGAHLTAADFVARLAVNSDTLLIGRIFGAYPLGLYTRASVLLARPLQQVLTPITSVMDPVLARLQEDPERYRRTFLRTFDALALVVFPFSAICLALARPLVLVVLGSKWTGAIPLFAAFALTAMSTPLIAPVTWLYQSQGRGQDQLRSHTIAGFVTVAAYVVGLLWGPRGVILSLAVSTAAIQMPIVYYIGGRRGPVSTPDLWRAYLFQMPAWVTVYLATLLTRSIFASAVPIVQLLAGSLFGLMVGGSLALLFPRSREGAAYAFHAVRRVLVQRWSRA